MIDFGTVAIFAWGFGFGWLACRAPKPNPDRALAEGLRVMVTKIEDNCRFSGSKGITTLAHGDLRIDGRDYVVTVKKEAE